MLDLLHQKNNTLQTIYELTLELSRQLVAMQEIKDIENASRIIDERNLKIEAVKELDAKIDEVRKSGYSPIDSEIIKRISMEQATMRAIILNIKRVENENLYKAKQGFEDLMANIRGVKKTINSVKAYGNPYYALEMGSKYIDTKR